MVAVEAMAPGSWNASRAAEAGVDQAWIARFGDRQLETLVSQAMAGNLDLRVTAEQVRRAASTARLAGAPLAPHLSGRLTGSQSKQRAVGFPFDFGSLTSEAYGVSLDVSWEPDVWGRVRAGQSAAVADLQAAALDEQASRTSLAAQLAKAWFVLGEATEQVGLAQAAVVIREKTAQSFEERFAGALVDEGGNASQLRLAQTDLATSRAVLARWQAERERAVRQVELLLGRYPKGQELGARGLPELPASPPAGLPSELLMRRPDVLAAERRFAAAGRRSRAAFLARFPSFSLTGSRGTVSDSLHEVLNSSNGIWSLGGGVLQPVLAGGRLKEEQRLAESEERIALSQLQAVVLRAFGEVEQALVAEAFFARREEAVREAARLANEAATAAVQDFADGNIDALTLLQAQDRKVQTSFQVAELRRLRLSNRVDLHLALGGDFQLRDK